MLAKPTLNNIKVFISKTLTDSIISHDEFVLINDVLKQYNEMKKEIRYLMTYSVYWKFWFICKSMLLYHCLKCRKNIESKNPKAASTKNRKVMLLSNCVVCDSKKSKFIKQQEASGLLSSLGIKASLSKIPLVGPLLLYQY